MAWCFHDDVHADSGYACALCLTDLLIRINNLEHKIRVLEAAQVKDDGK